MSSSKRDFTDFYAFDGELNEGTGNYEFPLLRHKDDADRIRIWQIFIRLVKDDNRQTGIDWNLLEEKQIPILDDYFKITDEYTDLPSNVIAEAWVETGIEGGKITRNAPTYFDTVANKDRANQRNQFQQAMIYARGQYLKRKEKGGVQNQTGNKKVTGSLGTTMYFPMLAKAYKDGVKHLSYPLYIQPKLDGVRCLFFLKKKDGDVKNVVAYSRTKKEFPSVNYLKEVLYPYLNDLFDEEKSQSIFFDGEMYKHGTKLQDISGKARNEKTEDTTSDLNQYHIYDCFYPFEMDNTYEGRKEQLDVLFDAIKKDAKAKKLIKPVPTILVKDQSEADRQFDHFTKLGYEGIILRNKDGPYLGNATKTGAFLRSKDLVKMKNKFSDEFEVVGYTEGKRGKDKGAVIWIAKTKDGHEFNVTPKDITYEERYKIFNECKKKFDKSYKGRMLTVEYEDLSKTGVPQRAKALVFRDYE